MVDDQIIALDGIRLRAGDMDARLKRLEPGTKVTLTFFRRDLMRTAELTVAEKPTQGRKLTRVKEPTDAQKAAYEQWLGQPWEP
jgi:predicted metalloprotease with PDZ domain